MGSHVDHGFDCEDHSVLKELAAAALSVVRNLRVFVELAAESVSDQLAYDTVAFALAVLLDGMSDVAYSVAAAHGVDAHVQ